MNAVAILALIEKIVGVASITLPIAIDGIGSLKTFAMRLFNSFSGRDATAEEEQAIDALIANLSERLQKPLSPE